MTLEQGNKKSEQNQFYGRLIAAADFFVIWRERKRLLVTIGIVCALVGCSQQPPSPPQWVLDNDKLVEAGLRPHFETEFDRLFLSQEPLRYQDNVEFLSSIQNSKLTSKEIAIVRAKLKAFLIAKPKARPYASDSDHTGISSEISMLRLQSVQILANIGTKADAEFIRAIDPKGWDEHPVFEEECQKAIKTLKTR
jgi:hypothetical protein